MCDNGVGGGGGGGLGLVEKTFSFLYEHLVISLNFRVQNDTLLLSLKSAFNLENFYGHVGSAN